LLIHLANAILLFLLLQRLAWDMWKSAFVAAFFAVLPINVESVAWVAERKNVLCTLFYFLTIWAYAWYAAKPHWKRYLVVVISFIIALMSKPMAASLPFVLLLLDYWPLRRFHEPEPSTLPRVPPGAVSASTTPTTLRAMKFDRQRKLILEKVPLILLAIADSLITIRAQRESGSLR